MKIHAVFNRDGGTFRTMDMADYCRRTTEIFSARSNDISCEIVSGSEIEAALEKASRRADLDAILAGGGDGTVSAAAGICWREGMPLGVVPAGTMNLFARSLHLPLDLYEVLEVLSSGRIKHADIATANGRAYVHQYSVGLHARLVRLREGYDFKSRWGKMRASLRAALGVMLDPPAFEAVCRIDGREERCRTSAISVSNNHFGADPLLYAETLNGGELGIYVADALTPTGVARLAFDILRGRLKDSETISERGAREVLLSFPRLPKRAYAVSDGELVPLSREVEIVLHAGGLKVLAGETSAVKGAG